MVAMFLVMNYIYIYEFEVEINSLHRLNNIVR